MKIEVSRPSVPLLKAEIHQNKGKTTANTPVSAENRSGTGRIHRAGHFDFPIHSKCPAEVSRCYPATVEADRSTTTRRYADQQDRRAARSAVCLLQEHERDGTLPTNARFLFYELVQRGQISKERTGARRSDQDLHDALTDIREDGRMPWDWIVDETRSLEDYTGYPTINAGVLASCPTSRSIPGAAARR